MPIKIWRKPVFLVVMVVVLLVLAVPMAIPASATDVPLTISENPAPVFTTLIPDQAYVIQDNVNSYKLYYAGNDFTSIKLATSTDGINWTPDSGNPIVISDGQEHADVHYYDTGFPGAGTGYNPSSSTMYYRMWYEGSESDCYTMAGWRYAESRTE